MESVLKPGMAAAVGRRSGGSDPAEVIVRLERVARVYRQDSVAVRALDGIDLEIRRGDFAVLVGPSGSGKTTLLNLIGALDSPSEGRIWVAGKEITGLPKSSVALPGALLFVARPNAVPPVAIEP